MTRTPWKAPEQTLEILEPQTATETLEAYKALGEKVETITGAYTQALVRLRDAYKQRDEAQTALRENRDTLTRTRLTKERDEALAKAEEWRKMHSEALGETARARDDLSIALRALDASRVSEAAWKGMYEAGRVSLDEAHATREKLPKTRVALPGDEPEFRPGDLARASTDTSPSSDFWPPIGRVDGSIVWLHYARGDVQCKKAMLVRKPVIAGDYVRVWRGPAQGIRGRVEGGYGDGGALRINGTDWVNLTDVVAVKP